MKSIRLSVVLLLATLEGASWAGGFVDPLGRPALQAPLPEKSRLTAVARAGNRFVATGPAGVVVVSDDGGASWRQVPVPVGSDLVALHFRGPRKGWAVGHDGVILHTEDGGSTWATQLDGVRAAAAIGRFYSGSKAVQDAKFREEVARFVEEGANKPFLDIAFVSDTEGFAVGAFNLAMRTVDGGKNWMPISDRTGNEKGLHLYALAQVGAALYLAGEQGLLRRWDPAAERFVEIKSPYPGSFFGALGRGEDLVVYGLQGNAFVSRDGGANWRRVEGLGASSINGAALLNDGRVVFASQAGKLFKWNPEDQVLSEVAVAHPMPFTGVATAPGGAVVAVGTRGVDVVSVP